MPKLILYIGDVLVLFATTLIGFVTHGEESLDFLPRFLAAFVPLTLAWLLFAPWFGLFQTDIISNPRQLWRVPLTLLFAAPLAVIVRSAILSTAVQPVFMLVFGVTSAIGLCLWRGIHLLFRRYA